MKHVKVFGGRLERMKHVKVFGGRLQRPSPFLIRWAPRRESPCRIRFAPCRDQVRGLSETSKKCANFCILGGIRPSYSWILAYTKLERKKHMGKHLFPSWHHFQIGFLFRPDHTFIMVTPRSVWPIVHIVRLTAVSLPFDVGFPRLSSFV